MNRWAIFERPCGTEKVRQFLLNVRAGVKLVEEPGSRVNWEGEGRVISVVALRLGGDDIGRDEGVIAIRKIEGKREVVPTSFDGSAGAGEAEILDVAGNFDVDGGELGRPTQDGEPGRFVGSGAVGQGVGKIQLHEIEPFDEPAFGRLGRAGWRKLDDSVESSGDVGPAFESRSANGTCARGDEQDR